MTDARNDVSVFRYQMARGDFENMLIMRTWETVQNRIKARYFGAGPEYFAEARAAEALVRVLAEYLMVHPHQVEDTMTAISRENSDVLASLWRDLGRAQRRNGFGRA